MSFEYLCTENRIGRFCIHRSHFFEEYTVQALQHCFIVHAERNFQRGDSLQYIAFHPDFSEVPEGTEAPLYQLFLDASGKITYVHNLSDEGFPSDWVRLGRRKC